VVAAPLTQCLALVEAVDQYPEWYPEVVRAVEVVTRDADGVPSRAQTSLHISVGPVTKDFDLLMDVTVEPPSTVKLTKVGGDAKFDVIWHLHDADSTRIELVLDAALEVPRFLPLGDVGNSVARGFVTAAASELERRGAG